MQYLLLSLSQLLPVARNYALLDAWLALFAADSDAVAALGAVRWQWISILLSGRTRFDGVTTLVSSGGGGFFCSAESSFTPSLLTRELVGWLAAL